MDSRDCSDSGGTSDDQTSSPSIRDSSPSPVEAQPVDVQCATTPEETEKLLRTLNEPSPNFKGRNLVVCIDGTANQFSLNNTHVVELYSRLEKNDKQLTYYDSGIGTFVKHSNWIGWLFQLIIHIWDMMVAWNLKRIVLSAYQWLSENYQPGDRIYLFGFSRGAYQVRIIGGMLKVVGLLHKGNNNQIAFCYELYLATISQEVRGDTNSAIDSNSGEKPKKVDRKDPTYPRKLCEQFKRTLCHDEVTVHFVGAWDTVSSVGITRGPSYPETMTGMEHVGYFCHCLSLDDCRSKFFPEYANGGKGPGKGGNVKEVWFTGSHSDIGGGNSENLELNSFGPPLRWMLYEAMDHGLRVKPFKGAEWRPAEHNPSMNIIWKVLEYLPIKRLSYSNTNGERCHRWPPNRCGGRRVQAGQLIHASVIEYMKKHPEYTPAATLNNGMTWEDIRQSPSEVLSAFGSPVVIEDLYSSASDIVVHLRSAVREGERLTRKLTDPLGQLTASAAGSQSIVDVPDAATILLRVIEYLQRSKSLLYDGERARMMVAITAALAGFPSAPDFTPRYLKNELRKWLEGVEEAHVERVLSNFGKNSIHEPIRGHSSSILSVTCSPDGKYIASGSGDNTIRLWDAETGHPVGEPLQGHTGIVCSVAFSPDGTRLISSSCDKTLRIWDVATQQAVGPPLTGHDHWVLSVAFSPDGKQIVSGSVDQTVRIWDAETGLAVGEPLRGHTNWVRSVAYSLDGRLIASGLSDHTVRIWDAGTHELVRVLEGHYGTVFSVIFTPDGRCVVSGSADDTIRVWDVESGETVMGPLRGHTDSVRAVAVSPDGKYIASGSYDQTVRLWDTVTGEAVGEPLRGHIREVWSVAFSPDGRRVVSGSLDKTLMI